jgi:hypothetical protein
MRKYFDTAMRESSRLPQSTGVDVPQHISVAARKDVTSASRGACSLGRQN